MSRLIVDVIVCMVIATVTAEPCITYENFTADSKRAPSHTESVNANKICDAVLSTKWYRLMGDAGSDLTNDSNVLVDDGCGTSYQLWMNGTVPGVSEGAVDRDICMRSIFSTCHNSFTIKVKNCCSFRVNQLKSATNCPQAYCISSSLVPSDNCSHIVWTTTTVTTTTSTTTTTTTSTTTTTTPATTSHTTGVITTTDHYDNENTENGNIIGITIGIVLFVLAIVAVLIWKSTATCICKLTNTKWTKYVVNRITVKPKPEEHNGPPLVHEAFKSYEHDDPKRGKHKSPALNESVKPKPGELKSPPLVIEAFKSNSPVKPKPEEHNYPPVVTETFTSNEDVKPKRGKYTKQLVVTQSVKSNGPVKRKPGEYKSQPLVMEVFKCDEHVISGVAPTAERPVTVIFQNQFNINVTMASVNHCTQGSHFPI